MTSPEKLGFNALLLRLKFGEWRGQKRRR